MQGHEASRAVLRFHNFPRELADAHSHPLFRLVAENLACMFEERFSSSSSI